jgi:hypothetical protein
MDIPRHGGRRDLGVSREACATVQLLGGPLRPGIIKIRAPETLDGDRFGQDRLGSNVSVFAEQGWRWVGVDNAMRSGFGGAQGTIRPVVNDLIRSFSAYRQVDLDNRDRQGTRDLCERERPRAGAGP